MSEELVDVLIQVLKSWEVLAVTGVLIVYFFLVSHAARKGPQTHSAARTLSAKKSKAVPLGQPDVETPEDDDLGLVEE